MAQLESDREDLLREATALVERGEFSIPGFDESVVIGFRRDGSGSIFCGADPVYQFNTSGELRRAYRSGLLLKAEQGRLIELTRQRTDQQVLLVRRQLSELEHADFLTKMSVHLQTLLLSFQQFTFTLIGQVPSEKNLPTRILAWLATLPNPPRVGAIPNVR